MIYNTMVSSLNESEFDELLENAEDRFKHETIDEAGAIIVAEQERNWTEFMKGIGLSELSSVMEGEEVIYEGARLESFIKKAKAYFKMALNKLAELTKSFIAKVMQFVSTNNAFLKKYEKDLVKCSTVEYKGYQFSKKLDSAQKFDLNDDTDINHKKMDEMINEYKQKGRAEKKFDIKYDEDESFSESVRKALYGEEKDEYTYNVAEQVKILKDTKDIKSKATKNYKDAAKQMKTIIKKLEDEEKKAAKDANTDLSESNKLDQVYSVLISYWKNYSNCLMTYHRTYMSALGHRNRQAKAICTKALTKSIKTKGQNDRNRLRKGAGMREKSYSEGADPFLGAVNFI